MVMACVIQHTCMAHKIQLNAFADHSLYRDLYYALQQGILRTLGQK